MRRSPLILLVLFLLPAGVEAQPVNRSQPIDGYVRDTTYSSAWNGVRHLAPSMNAVYDALLALSIGTNQLPSAVTFDSEWNTVTKMETIWGLNIIVGGEIDSLSELEGLIGTSLATDAELAAALSGIGGAVTNIVNNQIAAGAGIDATKLGSGNVDNTELASLNGISGGIQGQLDGKVDESNGTATGLTLAGVSTNQMGVNETTFYSTATSTNLAIDVGSSSARKEVKILATTNFRFYLTNALGNTNLATAIYMTITNSSGGQVLVTNVTDTLSVDKGGNWGAVPTGLTTITLNNAGFVWQLSQDTAAIPQSSVQGLESSLAGKSDIDHTHEVEVLVDGALENGGDPLAGTFTPIRLRGYADYDGSAKYWGWSGAGSLGMHPFPTGASIWTDVATNTSDATLSASIADLSLATNSTLSAEMWIIGGGPTNRGFLHQKARVWRGTGSATLDSTNFWDVPSGTLTNYGWYLNGNTLSFAVKGTASENVVWKGRYTYLYTTNGVPGAGETVDLASGLLLHYRFNEATTGASADDVSANNLDATDTGSPSVTTGVLSGARGFDSSGSQFFTVNHNSVFNTANLTLVGYIRPDGELTTTKSIFTKWDSTGTLEWRLRHDASGRLVFNVSTDGTNPHGTVTSTVSMSAGNWYMFACGLNGTQTWLKVMIVGGAWETLVTSTITGSRITSSEAIRIGSHVGAGAAANFYGLVDCWSLYGRLLNDSEIEASLVSEGPR